MRISDWSSDVCSSDLAGARAGEGYGVGLSDVSGPGRRGTVVRRSAGIVGRDPRCGSARAEGRGNPRTPRGNLTPDGRGFATPVYWPRHRSWRGEDRGRANNAAGKVRRVSGAPVPTHVRAGGPGGGTER